MKKQILVFLVAILFFCGKSFAQPSSGIYLPVNVTTYGKHDARYKIDSAILLPTGCGKPVSLQSSYQGMAMFNYDSCNNVVWIYNPKSSVMDWDSINFSGGGGTTVVSDSAWSLLGNAIVSGKFFGTTNAEDVVVKTNNTEQLRFLSSGGVRIPTTVDSTVGVIFKGSDRFIHNYQNPATATTLGQSLYIGRKSGNFNFTGASGGYGGRNLAIGDSTLFANTTGYRNVAIGVWNSAANTTGFENTSVGANALQKNTTGYDNTAIGAISMTVNTTGWRNTAVGFSTLQTSTTAERNTAVGGRAMQWAVTAQANVALGFDALAYNTSATHNTAIGMDALYYSDGTHNVAVGDSTLWGLYPTLGVPDQKHMGYKNTAIGSRAGYYLGDTYPNFASIFDTAVTLLGANASRDSSIPYTTSLQNMTVIGYNARGFASNQVVLGNNDVTSTLLKGSINARGYGVGARTGTAATYPAFDASGNIIESATPYGSIPSLQQVRDIDKSLDTYLSSYIDFKSSVGSGGSIFGSISTPDGGSVSYNAGNISYRSYGIDYNSDNLILFHNDSLKFNPPQGQLIIDTLNYSANADDSMMVRQQSTGLVGMRAIPTGGSSSLTVGTTPITSGTDKRIAFNNSGVYGESANLTFDATGKVLGLGAPTINTWTNTSAVIQSGNNSIFFGQATDFWLSGNARFNSGWFYKANGKSGNIGINEDMVMLRTAATGVADAALAWVVPIKADGTTGAIGGNISQTSGDYTGATLIANTTRVGIGGPVYIGDITTAPTVKLQVAGRFAAHQGADVASVAGAIALGTDGNSFEITGTNAITLISNSGWVNGSEVTLLFTSTATLTDGTANSGTDIGMELAGNTNFVASAGATLKLILSEIGGTQRWREVARSVQ